MEKSNNAGVNINISCLDLVRLIYCGLMSDFYFIRVISSVKSLFSLQTELTIGTIVEGGVFFLRLKMKKYNNYFQELFSRRVFIKPSNSKIESRGGDDKGLVMELIYCIFKSHILKSRVSQFIVIDHPFSQNP